MQKMFLRSYRQEYDWCYYRRDHLGNNVAVWNATEDYPTNGKKAKSELHLNYRYVLLSENDITKKYYHWIQLRNLSKVQKIFRNTCSLLWLVSFFILLPIIRLVWIITLIRLKVQKYKRHKKTTKPNISE